MVHWVVNLYEAVVERSKSGRLEKVIFRCKIILILYIFNLGKRVWKAAQKEMKRTANAEKNLQKKVETRSCRQDFGFAGRIFVLQTGFMFCRQDFCFAGRILFCRQDFLQKKVEPQCFRQDFPSQWSEFHFSVGDCSSKVVQWQ